MTHSYGAGLDCTLYNIIYREPTKQGHLICKTGDIILMYIHDTCCNYQCKALYKLDHYTFLILNT